MLVEAESRVWVKVYVWRLGRIGVLLELAPAHSLSLLGVDDSAGEYPDKNSNKEDRSNGPHVMPNHPSSSVTEAKAFSK